MNKGTPRDFFLYLIAVITLYLSVWRYIDLLFEYINFAFPDRLEFHSFGMNADVRFSIASLIVVFPVYLIVSWHLRKDAIANPEKRELRVRKWLLNFTLFLAAVTMISDLVVLVDRFLEGDLTARFLLKVLVVMAVAGSVMAYYLWDLRRETLPASKPSRLILILAAAIVGGSIVAGFFIIGSPAQQRKLRFDERRVSDLQNIQWQAVNYWQLKQVMPGALEELSNAVSGFTPPVDPETGAPYWYQATGERIFELCAEFALPSPSKDDYTIESKPRMPGAEWNNWNWKHEAGKYCFERTIDPDLYPPFGNSTRGFF